MKHLEANFAGHHLARLIEAILKAQGYVTRKSEPGKDGGIDILAGSGPLGFNEPTYLCTNKIVVFTDRCKSFKRITRSNATSQCKPGVVGLVGRIYKRCNPGSKK